MLQVKPVSQYLPFIYFAVWKVLLDNFYKLKSNAAGTYNEIIYMYRDNCLWQCSWVPNCLSTQANPIHSSLLKWIHVLDFNERVQTDWVVTRLLRVTTVNRFLCSIVRGCHILSWLCVMLILRFVPLPCLTQCQRRQLVQLQPFLALPPL